MKTKSKKKYIYLLPVLLVISFLVYFVIKADGQVVDKTYCSDVCPNEAEWVPFQIYKVDTTAEDCIEKNGIPNYAYGWSNEYLGCTPEGYKTLSEATKEMWSNQNN